MMQAVRPRRRLADAGKCKVAGIGPGKVAKSCVLSEEIWPLAWRIRSSFWEW